MAFSSQTVPLCAGLGLRAPHVEQVIERFTARKAHGLPAWMEVHGENIMDGGLPLAQMEIVRQHCDISIHAVGLSLGTCTPWSATTVAHLEKLRVLKERLTPALISDHLTWNTLDDVFLNDLIPLPYTEESLNTVCENITRTQETLNQKILIETPARYIAYGESSIPEAEFMGTMVQRTGCGILLDVNNIFVTAHNMGHTATQMIKDLPKGAIGEIHLAGHTQMICDNAPVLIDSHDAPVAKKVWELFTMAIHHIGATPTLIERDGNIPPLSELLAEVRTANLHLQKLNAPHDTVSHVA